MLEQLTPARDDADVTILEGWIAEPPATITEPVDVVIPSFDEETPFGPCPWQPRVTATGALLMPSRGDLALVLMSDEGTFWIASWWPYALP